MTEIRNTGKRPVTIGKTQNGLPIVIQVGKNVSVQDNLAEELCSKFDHINRVPQGIPTEREKSDRPQRGKKDRGE